MASNRSSTPMQLLKELTSGSTVPSLVHLVTAEQVRYQRILKLLKESKSELAAATIVRVRGEDLTPERADRLQQESLSMDLFSTHKLVLIERLDLAPDVSQKALRVFLRVPIPGVTFILWSTSLPPASSWRKELAHQSLVEFESLKGQELHRWTVKEFLANDIKAPAEVVDAVITLAGESADQVAQLVSHIALYLESDPPTLKTLAALFPDQPDPDDFSLIQHMNNGSPVKALLTSKEMLDAGRNPFPSFALLAKSLMQYCTMALAEQQGTATSEIRQTLGTPPWLFQKHQQATRRYSTGELLQVAKMIVRSDSSLKGRSLGPENVLMNFVLDVSMRKA